MQVYRCLGQMALQKTKTRKMVFRLLGVKILHFNLAKKYKLNASTKNLKLEDKLSERHADGNATPATTMVEDRGPDQVPRIVSRIHELHTRQIAPMLDITRIHKEVESHERNTITTSITEKYIIDQ